MPAPTSRILAILAITCWATSSMAAPPADGAKGGAGHADPPPVSPDPKLTDSLGLPKTETEKEKAQILPPIPLAVTPEAAALYCRSMEVSARGYARWSAAWGWTFGILAAGAIATGPVIIGADSTPSTGAKVAMLSVPAAGLILGYIANGLFTRAKDHGALAAQAALALNLLAPSDQVAACNVALAAWNTARSESSSSITSVINQQQSQSAPPPPQKPAQ